MDIHILNNFLHEKYILSKFSPDTSKKNYFNQLIQIRPPEGINAVVASPLMESKGWAPSIPSVNIDKLNTNLKDLQIGDFVNIETDITAKYVEKFLSTSDNKSRIDADFLAENGFV